MLSGMIHLQANRNSRVGAKAIVRPYGTAEA